MSWKRSSPLNQGLPDPCAFYHANSFAPRPRRDDDVLGTAEYGGEFVSVVERAPVYGLQSHPEKSGPDGLRLLADDQLGDAVAFAVGSGWGSRPLAQTISPKKSWEGSAAATVVVIGVSVVMAALFVPALDTIPRSVGPRRGQ